MDGVAGALVRHAEATFDGLSADEQRLAREIFRHLVSGDGARAQLSTEELHQRLAAPHSAAVLDKLISARLIAGSEADGDAPGHGGGQVEVIHDALLDGWPRLRRWIREDVDGARMRDQLRVAARQWSDRGRPRGLLWRDDVLSELQRWLRGAEAIQLSELEAAFVESSQRLGRRARLRRAIVLVAAGAAAVLAVFLYSWMRSTAARRAAEQQLTLAYVDRGQAALRRGSWSAPGAMDGSWSPTSCWEPWSRSWRGRAGSSGWGISTRPGAGSSARRGTGPRGCGVRLRSTCNGAHRRSARTVAAR